MKPSKLKNAITTRVKGNSKRSLLIEGAPGLGKTVIPGQVAKELGIAFRVLHAPLMQPEDYGFPVISQTRDNVSFVVSREKFPLQGDAECPDKGILLIDELPQCDASSQKILANLVQAREIHGHKIKDGWYIIATGNRASDRAGANRILSHLGNRVTRVPLEADIDDWVQWAIANGIKTEIIAFIRFRPELLSQFDATRDINPTPRAWAEGVSETLGSGVDPEIELAMIQGDVGEGAAAEFIAFLRIFRKLPNPDVIIAKPKTAEVPTDPATTYALCGALSARTDENNFAAVMEYIARLPQEFAMLYIRDTLKRNKALQMTKPFLKWAQSDGAKILL